jgi:23S rRNA pseudouridine1911/1915/1917 synthase
MNDELTVSVADEEEGQRLDVFVGRLSEVGSRSQAVSLLDAGAVSVDGQQRPKSFRLEAGQSVQVRVPGAAAEPVLEAERLDVPVVYEDEWLLVADKPAGMVVHPAKGHAGGTLVNALLGHGIAGGEGFRPGIVHRLDRDTSGLLLVAKDREVHRRLGRMIREREVDRRYLALVHGVLAAPTGTIDAPIGRDPARRKSMTVGGAAARPAVTHFTVLERFGAFTLLEARLETGRTHQLRVHFLAVGHPVVGDPLYARRDALDIGRQFLHSHSLALDHPVTTEPLSLTSPLPEDLQRALDRVREAGLQSPGRSR